MKNTERFEALLNGRTDIDRTPVIEWAMWWRLTCLEWEKQGLPQMDGWDWNLNNYWGHDKLKQFWMPTRDEGIPAPKFRGGPTAEPGSRVCAWRAWM